MMYPVTRAIAIDYLIKMFPTATDILKGAIED